MIHEAEVIYQIKRMKFWIRVMMFAVALNMFSMFLYLTKAFCA